MLSVGKTLDHKPKILKNGWWNVIFRKESWTVDHFLSRPLHTHHRLHIIQATCKDLVFDQKINIQKHACKKKMVLLKLHKIQTKGKNCIFWVICFSNTWYRNTLNISYGPSVHHFSRLLHTQEFYNHQTSIIRHFLWPFRGRMGCSSARALGKWEKMGPSSDTNNLLVQLLSRNNAKEELSRKLGNEIKGYEWVHLRLIILFPLLYL